MRTGHSLSLNVTTDMSEHKNNSFLNSWLIVKDKSAIQAVLTFDFGLLAKGPEQPDSQ